MPWTVICHLRNTSESNPSSGSSPRVSRLANPTANNPLNHMTSEQVEGKLIDLIHREPFMPFVVETTDGCNQCMRVQDS